MKQKVLSKLFLFSLFLAITFACSLSKQLNLPTSFTYKIAHTSPKCQAKTSTCWAFSTLSFLESEAVRVGSGEFDLSEMWIVYHAYFEKARNYIKNRGQTRFAPGGLSHDVIMVLKKYGIVREQDYDGKFYPSKGYDHTEMDSVLAATLKHLATQESLSNEYILNQITQILNSYLGTPPKIIDVNGEQLSPLDFLIHELQLDLDKYIEITSFTSFPFYTTGKLDIPDNWLGYARYYNVPLDEFTQILKEALQNGFSVAIDMDMTESGYDRQKCIAWIPESDLESAEINQDMRETLFSNKSTTDDHLQHVVGYTSEGSHIWYLIKDSLKSSYLGPYKGLFYIREDYVQLKVLSFMIHEDGVNEQVPDTFKNTSNAGK